MEPIRWGILSTGRIAGEFVEGLRALPDAQVAAVGARDRAAAEAFGERYGIPRRHGSYADLAADPAVDVIYVATPHSLHAEHTLLCLGAGKPVLCEKPMAVGLAEVRAMVDAARARGLFLMEALWTRFLPHMVELRRLLAAGAVGEVRMVRASLCFRAPFDPAGRLFDPALAGGALLDVGVYPVSLAHMLLGAPAAVVSAAHLGPTGVDEQMSAILSYPSGAMALAQAAIRTPGQNDALVAGDGGQIRISEGWWTPRGQLTLVGPDGVARPVPVELTGNGYNYEAAEVQRCLRAGLAESPVVPLDESLAIAATLDRIRAQWGLRYPNEPA